MDKTNKELKKLIEALQKQNRSDRALQGLNESPGPDNTEQLENIAGILERIEKALTGIKVDFNLAPMTGLMEQQTSLLKSISEEQALLRKISEGSLEYDKKMGAYRNTSGRDVVNKVSGKTTGKGGVVDFETARDPLAGQSKAVIERITNNKNTTNNSTQVQAPVTPVPAMPTLSPIPGGYVPGEKSELDKSIKALIEVLKVTPKKFGQELAKSLSSYKVPEEQKTTTEKLKEVVSIYKQMGAAVLSGPKALASGIVNIAKTGKSAFTDPKSFKEKISSTRDTIVEKSKEAFSKVSDIASAETDYTVERERFAKEFAKQRQQDTTETRSEKELVKEGKEKYQKIVNKESELFTAEQKLKEAGRQGFIPVKSDVENITRLKEELKQLKQTLGQTQTRVTPDNSNTKTQTRVTPDNSNTKTQTRVTPDNSNTKTQAAVNPVQVKAVDVPKEIKTTSEANNNRSTSVESKEANEEQKIQKIVRRLITPLNNTKVNSQNDTVSIDILEESETFRAFAKQTAKDSTAILKKLKEIFVLETLQLVKLNKIAKCVCDCLCKDMKKDFTNITPIDFKPVIKILNGTNRLLLSLEKNSKNILEFQKQQAIEQKDFAKLLHLILDESISYTAFSKKIFDEIRVELSNNNRIIEQQLSVQDRLLESSNSIQDILGQINRQDDNVIELLSENNQFLSQIVGSNNEVIELLDRNNNQLQLLSDKEDNIISALEVQRTQRVGNESSSLITNLIPVLVRGIGTALKATMSAALLPLKLGGMLLGGAGRVAGSLIRGAGRAVGGLLGSTGRAVGRLGSNLLDRFRDRESTEAVRGSNQRPQIGYDNVIDVPSRIIEDRNSNINRPAMGTSPSTYLLPGSRRPVEPRTDKLQKDMLDVQKQQLKALKELVNKEQTGGQGGGSSGLGVGDLIGMGGLGKAARGAGRLAMQALPYAAAGATMVAGGAAVDYGLGKLGVGKDEQGNDLQIDKARDDANWQRMSFGQKVQSGLARGIEKTGSFLFLDNMARQAQADRVKKESEYFDEQDRLSAEKTQDEANWQKMSFGQKVQSGLARRIERAGDFVASPLSRKARTERVKKETEFLEGKEAAPEVTSKEQLPVPGEKAREESKGILSRISDSVKNIFSFNKDSNTSVNNTSTNTTKTSVQSVTKIEQKIGPNWQAAINSYKESTPADHLEKQYPGIGKKFIELAKKNPPRTDSLDSIQTQEEKLVTMAVNAMVNNSTTSKTEVTKSTKLTELEESRKKIAAMEQPGESAAVKKGREKTLASLDREIERERSSAAPTSKDTGVKPGESVAGKGSSVPPIDPVSGKSQSPGVQPVEPISGKGESTLTGKASNLRVEAQKLGLDPNSVQGTYEGGVLTKIIDKSTGEEYPIDVKESDRKNVEAARNMRKLNERSGEFASVAAARQPSTGLMVNKQSTENADLNRDASAAAPALPPIISNNVSNNNNTSFVPITPSVRPEHMGSALDRYQSRVAVY